MDFLKITIGLVGATGSYTSDSRDCLCVDVFFSVNPKLKETFSSRHVELCGRFWIFLRLFGRDREPTHARSRLAFEAPLLVPMIAT